MTHPTSNPPWRNQAEKIFMALDGYDQLNGLYGKADVKASFSELYAYANKSHHKTSATLEKALAHDLRTRRDLKRLINKRSIAFIARAAAASSGDIEMREGNGFRLTLKTSKANNDQIYLIIEALESTEVPSLMFIQNDEIGILRFEIDDFEEGEAQFLLSKEDDVVKALRNHASEVILR